MVRGIAGVCAGAIVWLAIFYALAILLAALWPDYAAHARAWSSQSLFTFTTPMACFNLLFWVLAESGAGWAAIKIAQRRPAVWALAALLAIYLLAIHVVLRWHDFPWWYNLAAVIPAAPAVLLGARLAGALHSSSRTVAAA